MIFVFKKRIKKPVPCNRGEEKKNGVTAQFYGTTGRLLRSSQVKGKHSHKIIVQCTNIRVVWKSTQ